jgi:hypothetical protein
MKNNSPFASLASLRIYIVIFTGFALVLMAASVFIIVTAFNAFDTAWTRMDALEKLGNSILFDQNEVFIKQASYAYAWDYGYGPEELAKNLADRQAADDRVTAALDELVASGNFDPETYDPQSQALIDELVSLRQQDSELFAQLVTAYDANDTEQIQSLASASRDQSSVILAKFNQLMVVLEHERTTSVAEFPSDLSLAIGSILVGIAISMLLALWGYRQITGLTAPLLNLHGGVSAIGADTFRPEIVAMARRRPGQIGALARNLESLAKAMSQRDAKQKEELATLKQELVQSRRRRLRLTGKPSENQVAGRGGAQ